MDGDYFGLRCFPKDTVEVYISTGGNPLSGESVDRFIIRNHGSGWKLEFLVSCSIEDVN